MNIKELISKINDQAKTDFAKAEGMLDMFNEIYGTKFGFFDLRVVVFDNPDGSVAERYAHFHDVFYML